MTRYFIADEDQMEAIRCLDGAMIAFDIDGGNEFAVDDCDAKDAERVWDEAGVDYDIV